MPITLVVEDGSGNPNANAYASDTFVDKYHEDRGNTHWAGITDVEIKKACIIRATDYIDKRFGRAFKGYRMQKAQALSWPRMGAFDDDDYSLDDVPVQLQKALAEYALRAAIYNVLAPDAQRPVPSQDMTSDDPSSSQTDVIVGAVKSKTERVGPLQESTTYEGSQQLAEAAQSGSRATQSTIVQDWIIPQYPEADLLIEDLLEGGGAQISLVRA